MRGRLRDESPGRRFSASTPPSAPAALRNAATIGATARGQPPRAARWSSTARESISSIADHMCRSFQRGRSHGGWTGVVGHHRRAHLEMVDGAGAGADAPRPRAGRGRLHRQHQPLPPRPYRDQAGDASSCRRCRRPSRYLRAIPGTPCRNSIAIAAGTPSLTAACARCLTSAVDAVSPFRQRVLQQGRSCRRARTVPASMMRLFFGFRHQAVSTYTRRRQAGDVSAALVTASCWSYLDAGSLGFDLAGGVDVVADDLPAAGTHAGATRRSTTPRADARLDALVRR